MYLYRAVVNVPFGATNEFEDWWTRGQEALAACPGNVGAGPGIGLWNSLAQPSIFLVLTGWDDYAASAAAVRGSLGAWLRANALPAGFSFPRPGEAWDTVHTVSATNIDPAEGERHRYLRQVECNLRPNAYARFERDIAEGFALVAKEMPEVRASVLYRSAGIPGRYRVVFRMLENKPLPAAVAAFVALHAPTAYGDEPWVNELYIRAV